MDTKEFIKRIKYLRLKPEDKIIADILSQIDIGYNIKYPKSKFIRLNDKIIFELNSKYKYVLYENDGFWLSLTNSYKIEFNNKILWSFISFIIDDIDGYTLNKALGLFDNIELSNIHKWKN